MKKLIALLLLVAFPVAAQEQVTDAPVAFTIVPDGLYVDTAEVVEAGTGQKVSVKGGVWMSKPLSEKAATDAKACYIALAEHEKEHTTISAGQVAIITAIVGAAFATGLVVGRYKK